MKVIRTKTITFNSQENSKQYPSSSLNQTSTQRQSLPTADCADPYFKNVNWFHALRAQSPSLQLFPRDVACGIRPLGLHGATASPRPRAVVIGLLSHPTEDGEFVDEIKNALSHSAYSTGLLVHVDAHSGNLSSSVIKEIRSIMIQSLDSRSLLSNQTAASDFRVAINPFRIRIERFKGSILLGHLTNFAVAKALGWEPRYYLMMASNSRFFRCGVEEHVSRMQLSFGKHDFCHQAKVPKNKKGAQAYTRAMDMGPLSSSKAWCWVLCTDTGHQDTVVTVLATLLNLQPWENATPTSSMYSPSAALTWIRSVVRENTIVQQRHEGAYFPGIAMESLMSFLVGVQADTGGQHPVNGSLIASLMRTNSHGGLRILEQAWVAAEEFVLPTWIVHKLPELVPGVENGREVRDVTTYLVTGRSSEATSRHIAEASKKSGYFSAKRLVHSSKASAPLRVSRTECPSTPLLERIDEEWRKQDLGGDPFNSSSDYSTVGWGPCCKQGFEQSNTCRRCFHPSDSAPVQRENHPERSICGNKSSLVS